MTDYISILSLCLVGGVLLAGTLLLYAVIRLNGTIARMEETTFEEKKHNENQFESE